jgi:type III secretion system low calcium response chaperone LcrH/SycD
MKSSSSLRLNELLKRLAQNRKEESLFPDNLESYLEDFVPNILLKSETLQYAFGVTTEEMEELYQEGYFFYNEDNFKESAIIFRWLVLLNPYRYPYWMGLAANDQLLGKFEKALHGYAVASLLDPQNPYPHYHAYECYAAMKNREEASKALELAYMRTRNQLEHSLLKNEIEKMRKRGTKLCSSHP